MDKIPYHVDPGHGWLEVTPEQLLDVGLNRSSFSTSSYVSHNGCMYLEHDCDADKFMAAVKAKYGNDHGEFIYTPYKGDAPCRRMSKNHAGK